MRLGIGGAIIAVLFCAATAVPAGAEMPRVEAFSMTTKHDGTVLTGWVVRPGEGTAQHPVAMSISPYYGACLDGDDTQCFELPSDAAWWSEASELRPHIIEKWGVAPIDMLRAGYALVYVNARGFGTSTGCSDFFGPKEQQDTVELVEHFADAEWSNGKVALGGLSAPAGPVMMGAALEPRGLATVVGSGVVTSSYELLSSPQGAISTVAQGIISATTVRPPHQDSPYGLQTYAAHLAEGWCDETRTKVSRVATVSARTRDKSYWDDRNLYPRLRDSRMPILLGQGFADVANGAGHAFQEHMIWTLMRKAPKRQIAGPWAHMFPTPDVGVELDETRTPGLWKGEVLRWLDHWLRGGPEPLRMNLVEYQDSGREWRTAEAWPPPDAQLRALHLAGGRLALMGSGDPRSFVSAPYPPNMRVGMRDFVAPTVAEMTRGTVNVPYPIDPAVCPLPGHPSHGVAYLTDPLEERVVVAGNPFADLRISSSKPGGLVTVKLIDLAPGFSCDEQGGQDRPVRDLAIGGVDLEFRNGLTPQPLTPFEPVRVRVDLYDGAWRVEPGHRLALTLSYGEGHSEYSATSPWAPVINVDPASRVILPVLEGGLGTRVRPNETFPARPLVGTTKKRPRHAR